MHARMQDTVSIHWYRHAADITTSFPETHSMHSITRKTKPYDPSGVPEDLLVKITLCPMRPGENWMLSNEMK